MQRKTFAIISIVLILVAVGIFVAIVNTSSPTPAPAPASIPTHTIPEPTPPPAPEPVAYEYVYNPVEYYIAMGSLTDMQMNIMVNQLHAKGYNLSEKEIIAFREQHQVNKGDSVLVEGKVIKYYPSERAIVYQDLWAYVNLVPDPNSSAGVSLPIWFLNVGKRLEAGQEVKITLRGTAETEIKIIDCELVE